MRVSGIRSTLATIGLQILGQQTSGVRVVDVRDAAACSRCRVLILCIEPQRAAVEPPRNRS